MAAKKLSSTPLIHLNSHQVEEYRREGFLVVRSAFGAGEVADLIRGCDELEQMAKGHDEDFFEKSCYFNLHRDCDPYTKNINEFKPASGVLRRVTYPYMVSSIFNFHRTHPPLLSAVSSILGDTIVQVTNQVNFNLPGRGTGWGWHQDYRFRRAGITGLTQNFLQTLVAIDPCHAGNGGIRLIPRSHELGELALDLDIEHAEERFDVKNAVTPDLKPGDVVFFNAHVIHGSTANKSTSPRRVFINGFADSKACEHGVPVFRQGMIIKDAVGTMEYEKNTDQLPHTSKY